MLSYEYVILFCIYFYALKMGDIRSAYSDAVGLWWETRYRAIAESLANIILNYILGKYFGLAGIIVATLISLLIINFGYGSSIIFKYYFKGKKVTEYFKYNLKYFIVTVFTCIITYFICSLVNAQGIIELVFKGILCILIPNYIYFLFYKKDNMFNEVKVFINKLIKLNFKK